VFTKFRRLAQLGSGAASAGLKFQPWSRFPA
jgi:hypothetical protein